MVDLAPYNTLKVKAFANNFLVLNSPEDLNRLDTSEPYMFLGAGANVLFIKDFSGTIAKVNFSGIKVITETDGEVTIEAAAGHLWHDLVTWAVDRNLSGLENMALIPGTVGAAAVGNIAAYGGNQEDIFVRLQATNLKTKKSEQLNKSDCRFAYRESTFKHRNDHLITSVTYRLAKTPHPQTSYHDRYTSLVAELAKIAASPYSVRDIYQAVINIRSSKLPDWQTVGTAGSFFKNPVVPKTKYELLRSRIPELQWYPPEKLLYQDKTQLPPTVKIPAGRLLEELGWKGKTIGRVSTSPNQALYVINLGGATGTEIYEYAEAMRADIRKNFDIDLEYEILII